MLLVIQKLAVFVPRQCSCYRNL